MTSLCAGDDKEGKHTRIGACYLVFLCVKNIEFDPRVKLRSIYFKEKFLRHLYALLHLERDKNR